MPGPRHAEALGRLVRGLGLTGPLVSDAHLAAPALEHGLGAWSTDGDAARFPGRRWVDPPPPR